MSPILAWLTLAAAFGQDPLTGFRREALEYRGPGEWRLPVDPVWVYSYHTLRLRYRASGLAKDETAVLRLRPGSVGPVTPGGSNIENPFVAGLPVTAVAARDLESDGRERTLEVELRGKTRTAQIDQLWFTLPAGARLSVALLEFRADPGLLPCRAGGPALPSTAERLPAVGPLDCVGAPATSLRGKQGIRIEAGGRRGAALYLSLMAHFAGVSAFSAGLPADRVRVRESSETSDVLARVLYADGSEEEQFPLLVSAGRHTLLNLKPELYALELDPRRPVSRVELRDLGPHAQLVLFAAGISAKAPPPAAESETLPQPRPASGPSPGPPDLAGSDWFRLSHPGLRADFHDQPEPGGRRLSLSLTNTAAEAREFTLAFPSLTVSPAADAADVHYLFPRQGAVIGRAETSLEAVYSGAFPLQFVDVFAPAANRGLAVVVRDTAGRSKKFRLVKKGPAVRVEVEYGVRLGPGETWQAPDALLAPHGGDWREGFDAYRRWLASWYAPLGPRPAWLRSAFWARRDYPVGGSGKLFDAARKRYSFDELMRDGAAFGGIDFIDISGWALSETVGRVGDYPIELGGAADLRRNVALALRAGIPTGLYFEGYLVDRNSRIGRRALDWQIVQADGSGAWWKGGSPEFFVCPWVPAWRDFLSSRVAAVARETGAAAVYLDEFGFGRRRCHSTAHGHPPAAETLPGEIAMTRDVRRALDAAGLRQTVIYIEETPPDAAAPYYDAAFSYNLPHADRKLSPVKLNLARFAFPDVRLWDMLSTGIDPRPLPAEDFRLSLWHGNGIWLKGHSDTWYGEDLLAFLRSSRKTLKEHAAAFAGRADPLVDSPHPSVFVNRFTGGGKTVYTLFNASFRTARFDFLGRARTLGPRQVEVMAER